MLSIFSNYMYCSLSMSILILSFLAVTPWLSKKYSAKWIYYTWLIVVSGLIIPFRIPIHTAVLQPENLPSYALKLIQQNTNIPDNHLGKADYGIASLPWGHIVLGFWVTGCITFLLYHGLRHLRFIRMLKRWSEQSHNLRQLEILEAVKKDVKVYKQVELKICPCISSPMLLGFMKPVIVLPSADFSGEELNFILKHEMIHFKRKDLWYKCLILLATSLHWFNPVVYLMAKAIGIQGEISCDAKVMKNKDFENRQKYCEAILRVIKNHSGMKTAFSTNFYPGKEYMKNRIFTIMDIRKKKAGVTILSLVLLFILLTGVKFVTAEAVNNISNVMIFSENKDLQTTVSITTAADFPTDKLNISVEDTAPDNPDKSVVDSVTDNPDMSAAYSIIDNSDMSAAESATDNPESSAADTVLNTSDPSVSYTAVLSLDNGNVIQFDSYSTQDALKAAMLDYCAEQVKTGQFTEEESEAFLGQFK